MILRNEKNQFKITETKFIKFNGNVNLKMVKVHSGEHKLNIQPELTKKKESTNQHKRPFIMSTTNNVK